MTAAPEQAAAVVAEALAPEKVSEFVKAIDKAAAAMRRWAMIDQIVAGLAPIPWTLRGKTAGEEQPTQQLVVDPRAASHRLAQGINPVPWSVEEACDSSHPGRGDNWAEMLLQLAAFAHVRVSPDCRGYTRWSSGGAGCGCCSWGMSARMRDVGTVGSARFSQAALARVGQAIAIAVDEVVRALFEAVLP